MSSVFRKYLENKIMGKKVVGNYSHGIVAYLDEPRLSLLDEYGGRPEDISPYRYIGIIKVDEDYVTLRDDCEEHKVSMVEVQQVLDETFEGLEATMLRDKIIVRERYEKVWN